MNKRWIATTVRHAGTLLLLPILLIGIGTGGYMILQGFSFVEALYMTVITLATVGFGEVKPLDETGRLFTILLILTGAAFVAYQLAYFSRLMLDVDLMDLYRRRKLKKSLEQLKDHYIVCGYGQMGQIIVDELAKSGMSVVVVDNDESLVVRLREKGILHLAGDATEEENLLEAGIRRAKGLVSVVNKDTDNVFIVLTARDLNKDMAIFARAGTPYTEKRLFQAGANRVVSPFAIGAVRIAHNILRPTVTDFLELALSGEGMELTMEEMRIPEGADLVGKELMHSGIRSQYNLIVVAIKRSDGQMVYNPSPLEILQAGDIMVVIGPQDNLSRFGGELLGCPFPTIRPCKATR